MNQHPQRLEHSLTWLGMIPVLLLVAWLGISGLNRDALWYDEWLSVYYAGGAHYGPISVAEIWGRLADRSTWPPGFAMLLSVWGTFVGWHHAVGRSLSLFLGLLAVAWIYRLGRGLARIGLPTAILLGLSALFIYYLHELRGYTLAVLFVTMCVWSYWQLLTRRHTGRVVPGFFLLSVVGLLYTHYFASFTLVAIGLYHLLFVPKNRRWWRPVILMALGGLTFLPWFGVLWSTATEFTAGDTNRVVAAMSLGQTLEVLIYTFSNGSVALLALIGLYATQARSRVAGLAWFWLLMVLTITLLVNERAQVVFHIRHLLILWPPLALVTAFGIQQMTVDRRFKPGLLILIIWTVGGIWNTINPAFINDLPPDRPPTIVWDDFDAVLDVLHGQAHSADVIALHFEPPGREWLTEPVIDYYLRDLAARHRQMEQIPGLQADQDYRRRVLELIGPAPAVWLAVMPNIPSPYHVAEFQAALADDYRYCGRAVETETITLDLYARAPTAEALAYQFGADTISLYPLRSGLNDRVYEARLWWSQPASVPPETYSVAVHLLDSSGQLVAQADYGLPADPQACVSSWVHVDHLPPGAYTVSVAVYRWQDGSRLMVDGAGDHIVLDTLTIS